MSQFRPDPAFEAGSVAATPSSGTERAMTTTVDGIAPGMSFTSSKGWLRMRPRNAMRRLRAMP